MLFFFSNSDCREAVKRRFDPMMPGKKMIGSTRLGGMLITCGIKSWAGVKNPSVARPLDACGFVGS